MATSDWAGLGQLLSYLEGGQKHSCHRHWFSLAPTTS